MRAEWGARYFCLVASPNAPGAEVGLQEEVQDRVESRQAANAKITRPSAGTSTNPGDLVLLDDADTTIHPGSKKGTLMHER